jgi:predicted N-acetyltransferase YhbS
MTLVEAKSKLSQVEKLSNEHDVSQFDCQRPVLNDWLKDWALTNQRSDTAQTYVVHRSGSVVGYYSLTAGSAAKQESPKRIVAGLANHPVPVILLARLAVDRSMQGAGLGKALMKDAFLRVYSASEIIGARAVLVHALDAGARGFYERFGFERSPLNDHHLMLLMKDLRASLRGK